MSYVEPSKESADLVLNLDKAVALFNQVFSDVVSTKKLNPDVTVDYKVRRHLLNDRQCSAIKEIAGFLYLANDASEKYRQRDSDYLELAAVRTPWMGYASGKPEAVSPALNEATKDKTIAILKEYLIAELARTEELDSKIKQLEEQLLATISEKDKINKRLCAIDSAQRNLEAENKKAAVQKLEEAAKSDNPVALVDCYISKAFGNKKFFGLVTAFNDPYYQVVYEDADSEELSLGEVTHLLWRNGFVPALKAEACRKHAKALKTESATSASSSSSSSSSSSLITSSGNSSSSGELAQSVAAAATAVTATVKPEKPEKSEKPVQFQALVSTGGSGRLQAPSVPLPPLAVPTVMDLCEDSDDQAVLPSVVSVDSVVTRQSTSTSSSSTSSASSEDSHEQAAATVTPDGDASSSGGCDRNGRRLDDGDFLIDDDDDNESSGDDRDVEIENDAHAYDHHRVSSATNKSDSVSSRSTSRSHETTSSVISQQVKAVMKQASPVTSSSPHPAVAVAAAGPNPLLSVLQSQQPLKANSFRAALLKKAAESKQSSAEKRAVAAASYVTLASVKNGSDVSSLTNPSGCGFSTSSTSSSNKKHAPTQGTKRRADASPLHQPPAKQLSPIKVMPVPAIGSAAKPSIPVGSPKKSATKSPQTTADDCASDDSNASVKFLFTRKEGQTVIPVTPTTK